MTIQTVLYCIIMCMQYYITKMYLHLYTTVNIQWEHIASHIVANESVIIGAIIETCNSWQIILIIIDNNALIICQQ